MFRLKFSLWFAVLAAGCATGPKEGELVSAAVAAVLSPQEVLALKPMERQRLTEHGLQLAEIPRGKVVRVACSVMSDGTWGSLAIVPSGLAVGQGEVVRVRVNDPGSNEREGVNLVTGLHSPPLTSGQAAYRLIADWRERGLRSNLERIELPPDLRERYYEVHSSYLIRCW